VLATIQSAALNGLEAVPVSIEVSITNGLPAFHIVGLPDPAVREARQRVVSALRESGFQSPLRRVTATLAPAALRKEGAAFDLPIALAVLAATGQLPENRAARWLVAGELALDGALRRVRGAVAYAECAARLSSETLIMPEACAGEAALAQRVPVLGARSLGEVCGWLRGQPLPSPAIPTSLANGTHTEHESIALDDIAGQERAKRALEAAAAGGHNVVFAGPPGAGKTLLARALPGLLPPLDAEEAYELARIHSVAGVGSVCARPFRAPHSSISRVALLGGGPAVRPGEITLAHKGVLFLDELPEFRRDALDALRQPLEDGAVTIARASGTHRFPAEFQLVGAMNLCPCGNTGRPRAACRCGKAEVRRYRARLTAPLLDRVDIHLGVEPVRKKDLARVRRGFGFEHQGALDRVAKARKAQDERGLGCNARLKAADLERVAPLPAPARRQLLQAVEALGLSARGYHRAWRLGRTLADLDGAAETTIAHVHEALAFRLNERWR